MISDASVPAAAPLSITVVVMAYNEAENVAAVVAEIAAQLESLAVEHEILIVDDGSTDGTGKIADEIATRNAHVRVIHHHPNQGLGEVYRSGFESCRCDAVSFFPADGQFPASILALFAREIGAHDLVLGYLPNRVDSATSKVLSLVQRVLYRVLVGELPRFQGVLMARRSLVQRMQLRSRGRGATIVFELLIKARRANSAIVSVPTEMRPRLSGVSKVNNWRTIRANLGQLALLRRLM